MEICVIFQVEIFQMEFFLLAKAAWSKILEQMQGESHKKQVTFQLEKRELK